MGPLGWLGRLGNWWFLGLLGLLGYAKQRDGQIQYTARRTHGHKYTTRTRDWLGFKERRRLFLCRRSLMTAWRMEICPSAGKSIQAYRLVALTPLRMSHAHSFHRWSTTSRTIFPVVFGWIQATLDQQSASRDAFRKSGGASLERSRTASRKDLTSPIKTELYNGDRSKKRARSGVSQSKIESRGTSISLDLWRWNTREREKLFLVDFWDVSGVLNLTMRSFKLRLLLGKFSRGVFSFFSFEYRKHRGISTFLIPSRTQRIQSIEQDKEARWWIEG